MEKKKEPLIGKCPRAGKPSTKEEFPIEADVRKQLKDHDLNWYKGKEQKK